MRAVPGKLLRLLGVRSPSEDALTAMRRLDLGAAMARGIEESAARRAELLASGMTPEEAQAALWRELVTGPGFRESMAYAEGVARRSFWTLYEDDEESVD